jgi:phosphoribosylglycinamide formyltransferase-1
LTEELRLGVLVSGNGSNLQAILDAIREKHLLASVRLVVSNQSTAYALTRAQQAQVPACCISHRDFASREAFDRRVVSALKAADVEWVVLAGFMRLLTPYFLAEFPNRILNIHPSLLPAFPGVNAIGQALQAGVRETGCTVHLVDQGLDSGPILAQAAVPVLEGDTEDSLAQRVHVAEHRLFVDTLRRLSTGQLTVPRAR